ncbi:MAG: L-threonylcarbamoyladenylate synthase [Rubritalea sp.]|jgi:L-threonylcarbamoyladenylate synthase
METEIIYAEEGMANEAISKAVRLLDEGEVVALPTETVYGLGANALDPVAVAKIFAVKERPSFDPLIIHLATREQIHEYCDISPELNEIVQKLIQEFWPGPLTMVLPKKDIIPDIVTSGLATVAVRMSADPIMQEICKAFGKPIAAPSANRFGRISPTSAGAVLKELDGKIPLIVDGGACNAGLESTIIRVEVGELKPQLHLLRAGPVVKEDLQKFGKVIRPKKLTERAKNALLEKMEQEGGRSIEAPGMLDSHYAPGTPLYIFDKPEDFVPEEGKSYALLSYRGQAKDGYMELHDWDVVEELSPGKGKLGEASVRLFHMLRILDESGVDAIIAEQVAETGLGVAINDRLRRASQK